MIATGGLLRINARRQDSLRSKPHKAHTHKKRNKKKRRSEVVVVKGKLKLFSVSGLVAAIGILVLLLGVIMAALGYWPKDGLFFSTRPQESAAMASVSSSTPTPAPADVQGGERVEQLDDEGDDSGRGDEERTGGDDGGGGDKGGGDSFNHTETINGTSRQLPQSFLEDFLDRYLYSDRLKVFGPLIMGIGIFLFICANAVLHENRDKKTKVINLRDIYSTVIDLHSLRKPTSSTQRSSTNPLNGLVNYVQSKSLETKPRVYPTSLLNRREGGGAGGAEGDGGAEPMSRKPLSCSSRGGGVGDSDGGGNEDGGVFSIYQEQSDLPPPPSSSHRLSLPPSFSPAHFSTCCTSLEKETLNSFTLPLRRARPLAHQRRHSVRAGLAWGLGIGREEEQLREQRSHTKEEQEEVYTCKPPLCSSSLPPPIPFQGSSAASCSSSSLHREIPRGSQALLLLSSSSLTPSHLSLSSLSYLLSSSSTPPPPCRRRSLPAGSSATGYSKLTHGDDELFQSAEIASSHHVPSQGRDQRARDMTPHRKYSNREKLRMISQVDSGAKQEED